MSKFNRGDRVSYRYKSEHGTIRFTSVDSPDWYHVQFDGDVYEKGIHADELTLVPTQLTFVAELGYN